MRISVLGPLEVTSHGEVVDVRSARQRALLTALALQPGRVVGVSTLIDSLWGDDPPPSARNSLQTYVARLRDALGADVIATRAPGYLLDVDRDQVDVQRFEALVAASRSRADSDPGAAAAELDAVLALWRGPPAPDLAEPVGQPLRAALEEMRRTALRLRSELALARGDAADAVARASQLVAEEPLDEAAALLQARAFAAAGRVADALAALDRLRIDLAQQLGIDPTAAADELRRALLVGDPDVIASAPVLVRPDDRAAVPPPEAATRAGRPDAPLVGRHGDLGRLLGLLHERPLVTLVGPGGVGKTRLAREAAARWSEGPHAEPVWWVDLAPVGPDEVVFRVADALGQDATSQAPTPASLGRALAATPGLLVLDSCEHVLDAVASVVDELLGAGVPTRVLTTGRAPLALPGEARCVVAPLPCDGVDAAAVRLLRDRAQAAGVEITEADLDAARRICAALDGLPLAIELAAARLPAIEVHDLAERLTESMHVVDAPRRGGDERHRTLGRLVGWSLDLLDDAGRLLFDRLAIFSGSFSLTDAEAVAAGGALQRRAIGPGLAELVERSLIVGPAALGGARYRMLGPLRSVALDRLEERGERAAVTERLTAHLRELVAIAELAADTPEEARTAPSLDAALDDLRAVRRRALDVGDLDLVVGLAAGLASWAYWRGRVDVLAWGEVAAGSAHPRAAGALAAAAAAAWQRGALGDARALAEAAQARAAGATGPAAVRDAARAAEALGDVALLAGRLEEASSCYREVLEATTQLSPSQHTAAHGNLALAAAYAGAADEAIRHAENAVLDADAIGAPTMRAFARYCRGEALADARPDVALVDLDEARALAEACGARLVAGLARSAEVALRGRHGPPGVALERYGDAIDRWVMSGADGLLGTTLRNLVVLLARTGADADAIALDAALTERGGQQRAVGAEAERIARALEHAAGRLAPESIERARARGRAAAARREALIELARTAVADAAARLTHSGPAA